jgi:hypothetical protein
MKYVKVIKSRRIGWSAHVVYMWDVRNACNSGGVVVRVDTNHKDMGICLVAVVVINRLKNKWNYFSVWRSAIFLTELFRSLLAAVCVVRATCRCWWVSCVWKGFWQRKTEILGETYPSATVTITNLMDWLGSNLGLRCERRLTEPKLYSSIKIVPRSKRISSRL